METGLTYTSTITVSKENTAITMGSGDLEVFATPSMVSLMENAAMNAVAGELPEGSTTGGGNDEYDSYQAFGYGRYGFGNCRIEGSGRQKTYFRSAGHGQ